MYLLNGNTALFAWLFLYSNLDAFSPEIVINDFHFWLHILLQGPRLS